MSVDTDPKPYNDNLTIVITCGFLFMNLKFNHPINKLPNSKMWIYVQSDSEIIML